MSNFFFWYQLAHHQNFDSKMSQCSLLINLSDNALLINNRISQNFTQVYNIAYSIKETCCEESCMKCWLSVSLKHGGQTLITSRSFPTSIKLFIVQCHKICNLPFQTTCTVYRKKKFFKNVACSFDYDFML